MNNNLIVFSGRSNQPLAKAICGHLEIEQGVIKITDFADGEIFVKLQNNVRGQDVFILQSTNNPGNTNLLELLIIIDAVKRSSAKRITAVLPYYGYARQDRKTEPRVPITSKLVANLLRAAGTDRVLTIDLHAGQIQGFFDIPVDHLFAMPVQIKYIKEKNIPDLVVVSPDAGGVERARAFAKRLESSLAIVDKRREKANEAQVMNVIGDIKGKNVLIVDDMIDTAGTLVESAKALLQSGARNVYACCSHPVLSGPAFDRIRNSCLKEVIVTDTIRHDEEKIKDNKLTVLSIAPLLGDAISMIHNESSVSSLFD
ncbi:MAG: ribose-phosphate pyrophosphokinase [Nitrospinae bacterium]|nr:ribose-phosphate pyrophosphokinase [Nitrospinota bacterium]